MEKIKKYLQRPKRKIASDLFFWILILMLIIPSTRSIVLGGVTKLRTAIFASSLKVADGPVLSESDWSWKMTTLQGDQSSLAALKGELILLNSWATWCPPCRAEMPSLEKLYQNYGDRVKFVIISNEEDQLVRDYIDKKGYTFPVYLARSASPPALSSKSIPATFIINAEGQVIYQKSGSFDWNSRKVHKFLDTQLGN